MDTISAISLTASTFSTVCTAYFWMVRIRSERPQLKPFVIDREFFLGNSNAQTRTIGFKAGLVIANNSTMPNALIGAKVSIRNKEGTWTEIAPLAFDKQTPLPVNLPALQTALLRVQGNLSFPYTESLEQGAKTTASYLQQYLANPWQVRVELFSLNERRDTFDLSLPAGASA